MSVVNFSITDALEKNIKKVIKELGFSSRAEFFRAAAIYFINKQLKGMTEEEKLDWLTKELDRVIHEKFKGKKLPSLEEQLANI